MHFIKVNKLAADTYLLKQSEENDADMISLHPISDTVVPSANPLVVIERLNKLAEPLQYYELVKCIFDMPQKYRRNNLKSLTIKEMYDAYRCYCRALSLTPISSSVFSQTYQHLDVRYAGSDPEPANIDPTVCAFLSEYCEFNSDGRVHTDTLYKAFKDRYPMTELNHRVFVTQVRLVVGGRAKKGPVMVRGHQAQGFRGLHLTEE